jgi:hypothetical protein
MKIKIKSIVTTCCSGSGCCTVCEHVRLSVQHLVFVSDQASKAFFGAGNVILSQDDSMPDRNVPHDTQTVTVVSWFTGSMNIYMATSRLMSNGLAKYSDDSFAER